MATGQHRDTYQEIQRVRVVAVRIPWVHRSLWPQQEIETTQVVLVGGPRAIYRRLKQERKRR